MSKRYSGKSFKDSSVMKKAKLTLKQKRKLLTLMKKVCVMLVIFHIKKRMLLTGI